MYDMFAGLCNISAGRWAHMLDWIAIEGGHTRWVNCSPETPPETCQSKDLAFSWGLGLGFSRAAEAPSVVVRIKNPHHYDYFQDEPLAQYGPALFS